MKTSTLNRAYAAAERAGYVRCVDDAPLAFLEVLPAPGYPADELGRMRQELLLAGGARILHWIQHPKLIAFIWGEHLERQIQRRFDRVCHA